MKSAALLASNAHKEAIMNTHPGIGEWEIQSIIEAHFTSTKVRRVTVLLSVEAIMEQFCIITQTIWKLKMDNWFS